MTEQQSRLGVVTNLAAWNVDGVRDPFHRQDIIYRLRHAAWMAEEGTETDHLNLAADEIERLRAAGDNLVQAIRNHNLQEAHLKAWEEARRG